MYVILRDDDINGLTTPSELEVAYDEFLGDIPITFAAIPDVHYSFFYCSNITEKEPSADIFKYIADYEKSLSSSALYHKQKSCFFSDNASLISFLKKFIDKGNIEIAQHGVRHRFYADGSEMEKGHVQRKEVERGRRLLEACLQSKISTFIPPYNRLDKASLEILSDLGLDLLFSGSVTSDSIKDKMVFDFKKAYFNFGLPLKRKLLKQPVYKWRYKNTRVLQGMTYPSVGEYSVSLFLDEIKKAYEYSDFVSIATHYTTLANNEGYRRRYYNLINSLLRWDKQVKFVTVSQYLALEKKRKK